MTCRSVVILTICLIACLALSLTTPLHLAYADASRHVPSIDELLTIKSIGGAQILSPRSCFEPWLLFRKPCEGRVIENLKKFGTGALRRPSEHVPLPDLIEVPPARSVERAIVKHPSLKPQALMRFLVRASLPLGEGVVLDPFMGSGSKIAAATHLGLSSVGVELDPKYFTMARSAIPKLAEFIVPGSHNGGRGEREVARVILKLS